MPQPRLFLVYEPEKACLDRLMNQGYPRDRATEISSYLAQSTDLAPEFSKIWREASRRGIAFTPLDLDEAATGIAGSDPATTLVWTLTDGIAYFRGGTAPALARLAGLRTLGADDSLFALCQDKFRSGAVLSALGLPVPQTGLARDGRWLVEPPACKNGWFVKPNRLGAKIGIWPDSHCRDLSQALELSRRVFSHYRDEVVVQPYVAGRNVRASFLDVTGHADMSSLGVFLVESGADFQTMADSLALYGGTGAEARATGVYAEPELVPLAATQPAADGEIRRIASKLMNGLGLRDVFSIDLRVDTDDTVHLIEFEVCPGLPCFDFRAYCRAQWSMSLAEAMTETAARRLVG
ncbi:MAG TPA: D-alanine:D-lactate ligase-like protein [Mesorhizobium sp.]|jgi:D-alanine-D-alanine ligase|uniref:D-alanine:D-lactate ligase-like protein n=1 Tax=Mesorhizobium sp. TaxID=1871066 RepID=UPI002DDCD008|nr:D-alanine:D-lactate ligase-like protein [Mesorhizobium sp.]HEV2505942.1 D-alanine:D-lactate ligase-like protein [Mesorhizobium sp.]